MTVIVGIFDDAGNLDRAIEKLSEQGLDETVLDRSIESQRAFRTHLADYDLPGDVIDAYLTSFAHGGKFVIVRAGKERAAEVIELLKRFDAAQVNSHE